MDTPKDDENRVVKLVPDVPVEGEDIEFINFNIVFTSGNSIDTQASGFLFEALGVNTLGFVKESEEIPHLTVNLNNVDYIESGYEIDDIQWEE
jgi:hypothetical protein